MRSKTISVTDGNTVQVCRHARTGFRIRITEFNSPRLINNIACVWLSTKQLREICQAGIQMADEIDAAKEPK